jgi:glycosyltransferase involved in cell wall biosynthesis
VTTEELYASIVIPVYDEHESLERLHEKVATVMNELGRGWEVIYVDDGSTDGSTQILRDLQGRDEHVVVVVQRRNYGKSAALSAGFALAEGEVVITLDADLQDEPAEIPNLLAKLDDGWDVVSGWKQNRQDPRSKTLPSRLANYATTMATGVKLRDMNSGFKAYRRACVKRIRLYGDFHRYIPVLAHFAGFRVTEVPVTHHARQFGHSKFGRGRLLRGGLDLLTVLFLSQFGRRPMHLFGGTGAVMMALGFLINLVLTVQWFQGIRPIGDRPALILGVLLLIMGLQLLTIGLLAELIVSLIQRMEDPLSLTARIYRASGTIEPDIQTHLQTPRSLL